MSATWQSTVIAPRSGAGLRLQAGQLLRVVDVEGGRSGDLFAVAADDVHDGSSNGRTFDMGGTLRFRGTVFAAERDLFVAVTACAAPGCNGGAARPVRVDVGPVQ